MKKKKLILVLLAIIFPILWVYLQFNVPYHMAFKLPDNNVQPVCDYTLANFIPGCTCDVNVPETLGFPILWTQYGICQANDNATAKWTDITIGIIIELGLVVWIMKTRKKPSISVQKA